VAKTQKFLDLNMPLVGGKTNLQHIFVCNSQARLWMNDSLQNTEKEKAKLVFTIIYVDWAKLPLLEHTISVAEVMKHNNEKLLCKFPIVSISTCIEYH